MRKAAVKNAVVEPREETITPIPLTQTEQIAVEAVAARIQLLEQQQQQFMKVQAETGKQWGGLLGEVEKGHGLPSGSILRGEWAIIGGQLVKQGK